MNSSNENAEWKDKDEAALDYIEGVSEGCNRSFPLVAQVLPIGS